ncbi:TPA: hypothetical protein ACFPVC_002087, partial [Neisseria meningitidis]
GCFVGWASAHHSANPTIPTQPKPTIPPIPAETRNPPNPNGSPKILDVVELVGLVEWWAEAHPTAHPTHLRLTLQPYSGKGE